MSAFTLDFSPDELNERAAASVTSYGVGTRSYNRSPEKREMDRQREAATARYEASPHREVEVPLSCRCPQRLYPHELSVHGKLRSESPGTYEIYGGDSIRFAPKEVKLKWPWTLCASSRLEPSTEREMQKEKAA
jgi:hypothetical protein